MHYVCNALVVLSKMGLASLDRVLSKTRSASLRSYSTGSYKTESLRMCGHAGDGGHAGDEREKYRRNTLGFLVKIKREKYRRNTLGFWLKEWRNYELKYFRF